MSRIGVLLILLSIGGCSTPSGVKINSTNFTNSQPVSKTIVRPEYIKYIVANLATMKLRVYQLPCEKCSAELIFTTDMVVGKDTEIERTKVGYYTIYRWEQFHEDYEKRYLAWNKKPPKPGSARSEWGSIGAFGWYAALLEPNAGGQWLHGTLGWAKDEENFIIPVMNAGGTSIRFKSHGCTRVSNPTISFLKDQVPVGSYVFRIYAKEAILKEQPTQEVGWSHELKYKKKVLDKGTWTRELKTEALIVQNHKDKIKYARPNNPYKINIESLGTFIVDKGQIKDLNTLKN